MTDPDGLSDASSRPRVAVHVCDDEETALWISHEGRIALLVCPT